MFRMRTLAVAADICLAATALSVPAHASADFDEKIQASWLEGRDFLEPVGISHEVFRHYSYWSELQYYLGLCRVYLDEADFLFWRTWWHGSVLEQSDAGRRLLEVGDDVFYRGTQDSVSNPAGQELCKRTLGSWMADFKKVVGREK